MTEKHQDTDLTKLSEAVHGADIALHIGAAIIQHQARMIARLHANAAYQQGVIAQLADELRGIRGNRHLAGQVVASIRTQDQMARAA